MSLPSIFATENNLVQAPAAPLIDSKFDFDDRNMNGDIDNEVSGNPFDESNPDNPR